MGEPKTKKPREWKFEPFTEMVEGADGMKYPLEKAKATFRDEEWILPNTPAGREEALRRVNVIRERSTAWAQISHAKRRIENARVNIFTKKLGNERTIEVVDSLNLIDTALEEVLSTLGALK